MAERVRKKKTQAEYYFDYNLLFIVLFLLGFGLLMIYSVSSYEAYADYNDAAFYLKKQLLASILGLGCMIVMANIPYHIWRKFAGWGYLISVILIALVPKFGIESHGAKRWLRVPVIGMSLQPAEVAKLKADTEYDKFKERTRNCLSAVEIHFIENFEKERKKLKK